MVSPASSLRADRALRTGVTWNLGAFAVIGVAGVAMNILIAGIYPPWVLGAFNQVLAYYIVGGQIATFAIHYSVLYSVSVAAGDRQRGGEAALTGLITGTLTSAILCVGLWLSRHYVVHSDAVVSGLEVALPGLFLFPLNKILMGTLNGFRHMRNYAVANGGRYVLIVAGILLGAYYHVAPERISISLSAAEMILFLGLLSVTLRHFRVPAPAAMLAWARTHLSFGSRGVAGGLLVELNTRVDVLILGIFTTDATVGVFSIASIFAEGLYQFILILRVNYDPLLARYIAEGKTDELRGLIASGKKLGYIAMAIAGAFAVALYPFVLKFLIGKPEFAESWPIFAILIAGIAISAGYIPFSGILQQGGHPAVQSMLYMLIVVMNAVGNLILAPRFGAIGAAIATATTQACFPLVLSYFAATRLKLRI